GKTAVIDTGTTLLIAPPADADAIHKAIKGAVSQQGEYFVPCKTNAVVALTFGGVTYKISPEDLAREPTDQGDMCVSGIAGGNIGGADQWLVGDTFLKNVYSAYDIKKLAVGFAPIK
ncbi:6335_t:CDS:1, partial [Ambispora leptoticha]